MGPSLFYIVFRRLLLLLILFPLTRSFSSILPLCHDDERSALLQFKEGFLINKSTLSAPSTYANVESWKLVESSDCCSWDGIECDEDTGHVIGLDLSSSGLYGSIKSNSSLFHLAHLQRLNLAYNDFNYSEIPSRVGQLLRLTHLNLSHSLFSGQIPAEISKLSKLVSLDLSSNVDSSSNLLELRNPGLGSLVENLTNLEDLDLSCINISSTVPDVLGNLSSLTSLHLADCGLHGEFPGGIFKLPNLKILDVNYNYDLTGNLPEFQQSSLLEIFWLGDTSFFGELPASIGNLDSLKDLCIASCNFSGLVPSSLGNLRRLTYLDLGYNSFSGQIPSSFINLTQLTYLAIYYNNFSSQTFPWLGRLTKITQLYLFQINLIGEIPYLANMTQLVYLNLHSNQLTGHIPSWLMNLTMLTHLDLSFNNLQGPIPSSIHQLKNLEFLHLFINNLSGTVELDMFVKLKNLTTLHLSLNNITFLSKITPNATIQKFKALGLASCNLNDFPDFLREQDELNFIDLAYNNIQGLIPKRMWNTSRETLAFVNFSHNFLTGFEQHSGVLPWPSLGILDLRSNRLQGSLPIPPPSTFIYYVSNNMLSGEISPLICTLSSLYALDLANNNLSGILPPCLISFSSKLALLNLRNNNFHGTIPQTYTKGSSLRMIDFSQNQLQGQLPRSLVNCTMLEFLILGNNQIHDTFPHWLGTLPGLRVLILRSNGFHGAIGSPVTNLEFPKLRIIDLSYNNLIGLLPSEYIQNWNAMKVVSGEHLTYLQAIASFNLVGYRLNENYDYSLTITTKGIRREYAKILDYFTAIDLSSNRFKGEIPECIGNLKVLHLLNLSNNILIGHIPSSLAKLAELESLDLAQNNLSGEIPQQLTQLTFLEFLNVSHNNLTGPIPPGKQFDTFEKSSFDGNYGLCGNQLQKKCGKPESPPPPSTSGEKQGSGSPFEFGWVAVSMGYGSGLVIGVVIGHIVTSKNHDWFVKTFGSRQQKRQRRGQRN